ncbi:hypothetical protein [Yoonia sp. MH D7]
MPLDIAPYPVYTAQTLVSTPRYWQGLAQQVHDLLTVHSTIPAEIYYLSNMRRWILTQMAIALHFEHQLDPARPRLSPKSLSDALAQTKVASRNTVQAFLREMTRVQFTDAPLPETVRLHAPQVSQKSEKLVLIYHGIHLRALDTIDGCDRSGYLERNPDLLQRLHPKFARLICASEAWYTPTAALQGFVLNDSGSSILHGLVLATQGAAPDPSGRYWIGLLSVADMAQTYHVSPAHIARILSAAEKRGLIGWAQSRRRGACWLSSELREAYLLWQAQKLAAISVAFNEARAGV